MGQLMITNEGYVEIKQKIRDRLNETVNNFIIIGYYLKQVRDSMAYINDGYGSMEEFAKGEYGLSKSTADRFMGINTMFSVDGNSPEIKAEFENYGYSKLQEMLTMKPEDYELVSEDSTIKQMREIKALEREEDRAISEQEAAELPIIRMADVPGQEKEEGPATSQREFTPIEQIIMSFWEGQPEELVSRLVNNMLTEEILAEEICPSGSRTYSGRLAMLFFYDFNAGVRHRYIKDRKPVIDNMSYKDFLSISYGLCDEGYIGTKSISDIPQEKAETKKQRQEPEDSETEGEAAEDKPESPEPENETYRPLEGQVSVEEAEESLNRGGAEDEEPRLMEQIHDTIQRINMNEKDMQYGAMLINAQSLLGRLEKLEELNRK